VDRHVAHVERQVLAEGHAGDDDLEAVDDVGLDALPEGELGAQRLGIGRAAL